MIETLFGIALVGGLVALFWKFIRPTVPQPSPLEISADDSEMVAARQRAQETIAEFLEFCRRYPGASVVKVPFVTSSGITEHVVAQVLQAFEEALLVRIESEPVTHHGDFERIQRFPFSEISDWVITLPNGRRRGGYTMQVQFARRRAAGALTPDLAAEEQLYDWDASKTPRSQIEQEAEDRKNRGIDRSKDA